MYTKHCHFCGRQIDEKRWSRHRCVDRMRAQRQYNEYCDANDSLKSRFPTWESFDSGVRAGDVSFPDYIGFPVNTDVDAKFVPEGGQTEPTPDNSPGIPTPEGQASMDYTYNGGTEPPLPDGGLLTADTIPAPQEGEGGSPKPQLTSAVGKILGKAAETRVLANMKVNKRELAWSPIISLGHELIMWVCKAKEKNKYFKLTKEQRRDGCTAYQNFFGDSPILKITKKGFGSDDVLDPITWHITVHGDVIMDGIGDGTLWGRAKAAFGKLKKKKEDETHVVGTT